jgi:hypothetical protein
LRQVQTILTARNRVDRQGIVWISIKAFEQKQGNTAPEYVEFEFPSAILDRLIKQLQHHKRFI